MKKYLLISIVFTLTTLLFSGCVNKHGVSIKYYSDCKEYYDLQGYYHKECGQDDVMTYKEMNSEIKEFFQEKKEPPQSNVW